MENNMIKGDCYMVKYLTGRVFDPDLTETKCVYVGSVNSDIFIFAHPINPNYVELLYIKNMQNINPSSGVRLSDTQSGKVDEHLERAGFTIPVVHPDYHRYEPREGIVC